MALCLVCSVGEHICDPWSIHVFDLPLPVNKLWLPHVSLSWKQSLPLWDYCKCTVASGEQSQVWCSPWLPVPWVAIFQMPVGGSQPPTGICTPGLPYLLVLMWNQMTGGNCPVKPQKEKTEQKYECTHMNTQLAFVASISSLKDKSDSLKLFLNRFF